MKRRFTRAVAPIVVGLSLLMGCTTDGLAFRVDERVSIVTPEGGAEVPLPITIKWTAEEVDEVASYGVYIDDTPVRPGGLFSPREGEAYQTTETELVIEQLPFDTRDDDEHRATIVLLDEAGRRVGESFFEVEFGILRGES